MSSPTLPFRKPKSHSFSRNAYLYLLLVLPMAYFVLFKYVPLYGVSIAFKDFNIFAGIADSEWNGLAQFTEILATKEFWNALRNTFVLNGLDLLIGFPVPIVLAILINDIRQRQLRKGIQTLLYLPHFLSWVIIGGIVLQVFSPDRGLINVVIKAFGGQPVNFLTENWSWVAVYVGVGVWQSAGWGTILYLAAMAGINPELYEAAEVDGASRFQRMLRITLPSLVPVMIILFILQVGRISAISFDRPFILGNTLVNDVSQVISTYVYDVGLRSMRFNIATAVGLFQSLVGLVFLLATNWLAEKNGQEGIYK